MKITAWVLVITLLAILGAGIYLYLNAYVMIGSIVLSSVSAEAYQPYFNDIARRLEEGTAAGTAFTTQLPGSADMYVFRTYTVTVQNKCFIPAEMIEAQICPAEGDIMQLAGEALTSLPAHSAGTLGATVLSRADSHAVREIRITYYLWGYLFTVTKTYG
jgi:hypothetical protein